MERCVALLEEGPSGTRLIDRTFDLELCAMVAAHFAALRRAELRDLETQTPLRGLPARQPGDEQ